jgi:hypothetical protein
MLHQWFSTIHLITNTWGIFKLTDAAAPKVNSSESQSVWMCEADSGINGSQTWFHPVISWMGKSTKILIPTIFFLKLSGDSY